MHKRLLDLVVTSCQERVGTDCPTADSFSKETLEEAVVELAALLKTQHTCGACGHHNLFTNCKVIKWPRL